jgi:lysozyme
MVFDFLQKNQKLTELLLMMRYFKIICLIIMGLTLLVGSLFYFGYLRFNYPSKEKYPIQGIDISHHQGDIDWAKLKTEGLHFCFIKATEGGDYKDPKFNENWNNSIKIGYATGAYHFYRLCKTGEEQAQNFISTVPKISNALPPVLDLEFGGNCNAEKSKTQIITEIQTCLQLLEQHYHK